jgi:nucleolar protein 56
LDANKKIVEKQFFKKNINYIVDSLEHHKEGKPSDTMKSLIEKLEEKKVKKIESSNSKLLETLSKEYHYETEYIENTEVDRYLRRNIVKFSIESGFVEDITQFKELSHRVTTKIAREAIRKRMAKRENLLIPSVQLLNDLDTLINGLTSRMREWYSIHFPEMDFRIKNHEVYAKIILKMGYRSNISIKSLQELTLKKKDAKKIEEIALESIGANLYEVDMTAIQEFASQTLELYKYRENLSNYISNLCKDIAPNIHKLAGPILGAKLIEKAGSLRKLALMPASTIQVLGAEKAMFRALKTHAKPPKHGLIFQHPYVHSTSRKKRGSNARRLAAKLAIAARADLFTGNFIADDLYAQLNMHHTR